MRVFRKNFLIFTLLLFFILNFIHSQSVVTVKVVPSKKILYTGQLYKFVAIGYDENGKEVDFSPEWDATGGTIDQKGWFKAGNKAGVYTVMATDPKTGAQGSAAIIIRYRDSDDIIFHTIKEITRLKIFPSKVELRPGESVKFIVKAYNNRNKEIPIPLRLIWKVKGGSISEDGVFKAGGVPGEYLLKVMIPNSLMTTAQIKIKPSGKKIAYISIYPNNVRLHPYEQKRFFATAYDIAGNPINIKPIWEASGGTIDSNGIYIAGNVPGTYYIKAIGPGGVSSTSKIVIEQVKISKIIIYPDKAILNPNQIIRFKITAYDSQGNKVKVFPLWSATGGIIQMDGTYQAGNIPGRYTVTVTVGNLTLERPIIIKNTLLKPAKIVLKPKKVVLHPGEKVRFKVKLYNKIGQPVGGKISWIVQGGIMDRQGIYTAGDVPGTYYVKVYVNKKIYSKSIVIIKKVKKENKKENKKEKIIKRQNKVTIIKPGKEEIASLTIEPSFIQLRPGEKVKFKVKAYDTKGNLALCPLSWTAEGGKISPDGTYKAGYIPGTYKVTVSTLPNIKIEAKVIIKGKPKIALPYNNLKIKITPKYVKLKPGERFHFQANLLDLAQVNPKIIGREMTLEWEATGGTIDAFGNYTAGNIPGTYYIKVKEVNSGISDQAKIIIEKKQKIKYKKSAIRLIRWKTGHGTRNFGRIYIKGRICSPNAYLLRLILIKRDGTEKILSQIPVKIGQRFEFRGTYYRKTTKGIAIKLLDKNYRVIYKFERPS